jgi:quercetin dioxygenase-like cupin family protein
MVCFDGADESQMAFWTGYQDRISDEHSHEYGEYMVCVHGQHKVKMNNEVHYIKPGRRIVYTGCVAHSGKSIAGKGQYMLLVEKDREGKQLKIQPLVIRTIKNTNKKNHFSNSFTTSFNIPLIGVS